MTKFFGNLNTVLGAGLLLLLAILFGVQSIYDNNAFDEIMQTRTNLQLSKIG